MVFGYLEGVPLFIKDYCVTYLYRSCGPFSHSVHGVYFCYFMIFSSFGSLHASSPRVRFSDV
jgi:hypothetical protein